MKTETKMKNVHEPNSCSIRRWLLTAWVSFFVLIFSVLPMRFLLSYTPFSPTGPFHTLNSFFVLMLSYALAFWTMVICLKKICHTSVQTFIYGKTGKFDFKRTLILIGLFLSGLILTFLFNDTSPQKNTLQTNIPVVNCIAAFFFVWMQTTLEEFLFRGLLIRYAGQGICRFTLRLIIAGCISSLLFMILHLSNPEYTGQIGSWDQICCALSYLIVGLIFYSLDLCFGDLTPGIVIHWVNNMIAFTLISSSNSINGQNTLFVFSQNAAGAQILWGILLTYTPICIYLIVTGIRKKLPCQSQNF